MRNIKTKIQGSHLFILFLLCTALMSFSFGSRKPGENARPSSAPVDLTKAKIGDGFGERIHPSTKEKKMHTGIDFILPEGEPVTATADGTVTEAGNDEYRGSYVVIKHNEMYSTSYSHLKSAVVKAGETIKKKQLIGSVGSTGKSSSGPHLHYEVIKDGKNVNPVDYLPKSLGIK